ncbi:unnamed protein product [Vitrella brassicaformis CCMP3155]|uniref:Uncharacterized protein n=1 Tax=Vitrella brassicaformis (strain CCMP3155) TaxID=1169540 RepID=A0A0G4FUN4_VITBC|nr:unnamed protein product [Vitrella brassicaformis CCMP3155]|eukprot:CEM18439.1 unnamed protein product [Vitrella brassicaformis CCMP3155]
MMMGRSGLAAIVLVGLAAVIQPLLAHGRHLSIFVWFLLLLRYGHWVADLWLQRRRRKLKLLGKRERLGEGKRWWPLSRSTSSENVMLDPSHWHTYSDSNLLKPSIRHSHSHVEHHRERADSEKRSGAWLGRGEGVAVLEDGDTQRPHCVLRTGARDDGLLPHGQSRPLGGPPRDMDCGPLRHGSRQQKWSD